MKSNKTRSLLITWALTLAFTNTAHSKVVERVLAVVEGQMILKSELENFSKRLKRKSLINENLVSFLGLKTNTNSNKDILNYLISKKIISIYSLKDLNIPSTENLIAKEISNLAKQNRISPQKLKSEITSRGINFEDYKKFIGESSLIRSAIEKNVISQVRPTEEDFVSYLNQNGVSGIVPSFVFNLDQIFIPKSVSGSKKLANSINKNNFRENFTASKNSKIEAIKLGNLRANDLSSTHSISLQKISQGDVSSVFEEKNGYRIFFVNQKKGNFNIPNTKKVQGLQKKFYDSKIKVQFVTWYNEIKNQFFVRIND